jgi:adenylyl-sulfate kinase
VLDGDNLRHGLCADLGFGPEDRAENIRRAGHVAALLADVGAIVVTAFVSPFRADRAAVRELLGVDMIEAFVDAPLAACEQRDPKGLYKKARAGQIPEFTGISSPYEPPESPDVVLRTAERTLADCAGQLLATLRDRGAIPTTESR